MLYPEDRVQLEMASSMPEEEYDMEDVNYESQSPRPNSLSRLSMCTTSPLCYSDEDDDDVNSSDMMTHMSRLSIESFEGDADEELSEGKGGKSLVSSDSDEKEDGYFYSLPSTPRRQRRSSINQIKIGMKDYASENDAQKGTLPRKREKGRKNAKTRSIMRGGWMESEESEGTGGVVVITRPKGGRRPICMDIDEVKACKDLGFELEDQILVEPVPSRLSLSVASPTSSGGDSPIANWRISSPGDDPREVKARLKVWAQAVAIASTTQHSY